MEVYVKHAGKTHPVQLDINSSAINFKNLISEKTGVPAERMKVMVKGGILKDETNLASLGFKEHQIITVIGTAAPLVDGPSERPVFLEDLGDANGSHAHRDPPGLVNLGQTCYLNSSLQALRQIPQLKSAFTQLPSTNTSVEARFTSAMRDLYSGMEPNGPAIAPLALLTQLRVLAPQFAEVDERSGGFAQQDADEVWTQIVSALRSALPTASGQSSFIDDYMSLEITKTSRCVEAPEEPVSIAQESALKLECNISISTNFLLSGVLESLDQHLEKNSPSLSRMAQYEQKCRLSRLPEYLAVHMVRFYWRRDIQKKAKIMRKVKYPLQLDVSELLTDSLRDRTRPITAALKSSLQARDDRAKQIKQLRGRNSPEEVTEAATRSKEREQYAELVSTLEQADAGCNPSSMYELCALVTHKGASADSGHYIGWARKDDGAILPVGEEEWYKYDDDKVSTVNSEKILAMDGGGQDSIAYILLYRALRP